MSRATKQQAELFESDAVQAFDIEGGHLLLFRQVFATHVAEQLFIQLRDEIAWRQDDLLVAGKRIPIPRLQAWYGDRQAHYAYSGLSLAPSPWNETLLEIKRVVEAAVGIRAGIEDWTGSGVAFNSVLLNLYRDGKDSVGWHSDDEPELGPQPVIASLSLGATRSFVLRHKRSGEKIKLQLEAGSLLLMAGRLQHNWQHQVPKTRLPVGERINLTFRLIQNIS